MPQQAEAARQGSDKRALLRRDTGGREGLDRALVVEDAQRGVFGVRDSTRLVGDALQYLIAIELRCECQARGVHRLQLLTLLLERLSEQAQSLAVRAVAPLEARQLSEDHRR